MSDAPFEPRDLLRYLNGMLGIPYWYSCNVSRCTQDLLDNRRQAWPAWYRDGEELYGAHYEEDIENNLVCCDCVGLFKSFFWLMAGSGVNSLLRQIGRPVQTWRISYQAYVPDTSADWMYDWLTAQLPANEYGNISTMNYDYYPIYLHSAGHCGVYVGNHKTIECSYGSSGVVAHDFNERPWGGPWEHWAMLPEDIMYRWEPPTIEHPEPEHYIPPLRINPNYRRILLLQPLLTKRRQYTWTYLYT